MSVAFDTEMTEYLMLGLLEGRLMNSVNFTALSEVSKMTTRQGIHNNVARDGLLDLRTNIITVELFCVPLYTRLLDSGESYVDWSFVD